MTYLDNSNIPDEYKEQIAQLIESNDENNWELVRQLFVGWYNDEFYFDNLMRNYRKNSILTIAIKINLFLGLYKF